MKDVYVSQDEVDLTVFLYTIDFRDKFTVYTYVYLAGARANKSITVSCARYCKGLSPHLNYTTDLDLY